ncbi:MAG TPA: ATP-binding protein [Kofleriaceae bacterium]|jgi:signal transduction histidine kinase
MTEERQLRLLMIDDDRIDRLAIRRAIEQSGLSAVLDEVESGEEALEKVKANRYDCLLLDNDLPRMSGIDVTIMLRDAGDMTPIVFVTGQQDEELLQRAVDAGVTDFFPKNDLSPRRLALRIRFAIRIGRAEEQSQQALEAANQAARARDDVLAVVSHDLRGPLHAISLATEALREELPGEAARYLGAIERAGHRAERLIHDLLEASAIENGALTLTRGAVDAGSIVRQAAADHELLAKESGGRITAHLPDDAMVVSADRDRVLQVLSNLIGNALKHARGAPIDIIVASKEHEAVIAVKDAGPGIADAELPHVFDRYWHGRTKKGGAGLGLAIAKGIIEAHGGRVDVESKQGEGTAFSFTLPLAVSLPVTVVDASRSR